MDSVTRLVDSAVTVAIRAAREWLAQHPEVQLKDWSMFSDALRASLKSHLPQALDDAKAALAAGMPEVAQQTFFASAALAGIDAIKTATAQ